MSLPADGTSILATAFSDFLVFLVINASGKMWDGVGWNVQGKEFFSVAQATRSLHEEGEDTDKVLFVSPELHEVVV